MDCDEIEELSGAYALRALPDETLLEVEQHLAGCDRHGAIAGLRTAAAALALAADEKRPPWLLKRRIMARARRDAAAPAAPTAWSAYALAAALAVAVAALLVWNFTLQLSGDDVDRGAVVRSLTGDPASGRLLYLPEEQIAVIEVEGLQTLPPDETYQVWAISEGTPSSVGLFSAPPDRAAVTVIEVDLSGVETVAVTIEPAGGSPQPTSEPILTADL